MKKSALVAWTLLTTGCLDTSNNFPPNQQPQDPPSTPSTGVQLTSGRLTDDQGRTLYYFASDVPGTSAGSSCAGTCADSWPPFHADGLVVGAGLNASLFSEITRGDGRRQTTYRGWPLYSFANDTQPGDQKGEGVGGVWFTVPEPFYTILVRNSAATGPFLATADGRTLYRFARDIPAGYGGAAAVSNCSGDCLTNWPLYSPAQEAIVPSSLSPGDFSQTARSDNQSQLAFAGWPLYTFANDAGPGATAGDGAAGAWFVAARYDISTMTPAQGSAYLANAEGRTMYTFANDTPGTGQGDPASACVDACLDNWPIVPITEPRLSSNLASGDFSSFVRPDGGEQATFRGQPLYYFANDAVAGDRNGDGAGGVWSLAQPQPDGAPANVQLANGRLTDGEGRTLYYFASDVPGPSAASRCAGGCLDNWPIFHQASIQPGPGLSPDNFGTLNRADGEPQTTYRGWPLYTFANDAAPGDTNGEGVGGAWFVLPEPFYTVMLRRTPEQGDFLVDAQGRTLYNFADDLPSGFGATTAVSSCEGACAARWPLFDAGTMVVPSALATADFGTVGRGDGNGQLSYQGWPLYYFENDVDPGETNGDGAGGVWFLAADFNVGVLRDADKGAFLTNAGGRAMYIFENDTQGSDSSPPVSACTGGCVDNWPLVPITTPSVASLLSLDDFSVLDRPDGNPQLVYRGWPLYYFANDTQAGDVNGDGAGDVWLLAAPDL